MWPLCSIFASWIRTHLWGEWKDLHLSDINVNQNCFYLKSLEIEWDVCKQVITYTSFYSIPHTPHYPIWPIWNTFKNFNFDFTFLGSVKTSFKDPTPPGGGGPLTNSNSTKNLNSLIPKPQSEAKKIDVISRIVFPASFLAFNVMYWSYYLTRNVKVKWIVDLLNKHTDTYVKTRKKLKKLHFFAKITKQQLYTDFFHSILNRSIVQQSFEAIKIQM